VTDYTGLHRPNLAAASPQPVPSTLKPATASSLSSRR